MNQELSVTEIPKIENDSPQDLWKEFNEQNDFSFKKLFERKGSEERSLETTISASSLISKGFITNEIWDKVIRIDGKISVISTEYVICDCLIDPETRVFQSRKFDSLLFKNLKKIKKDKLVQIKIMTKPGATRIDVYDGEGLIDEKTFNVKEVWQKDFSSLEKKLTRIDL